MATGGRAFRDGRDRRRHPRGHHRVVAAVHPATRLAAENLVVVDGEPTAAQLAAAQKATRPAKPESLSFEELKADWRADARG